MLPTSFAGRAALIGASLVWTLCAADAAAQTALPAQAARQADNTGPTAPSERPRFEVAIGMGISVDNPGLSDGRTVKVPSFQVQAGVDEGPLGFELRLFSSSADGRYRQANGAGEMAVNRVAVDLMIAWRPLNSVRAADSGSIPRLVRSLTAEVGPAFENVISSQTTATRRGFVFGAHLDFPLTPATDGSELRIRLSARRLLAGRATVGATPVSDSRGEVIGALAFVF